MVQDRVIEFASTADGTAPLYAQVFRDDRRRNLPIVAVMPGFNGTRQNILPTCIRLAEKEICAVAVDMRGRGESAGTPDAGAVEIHDIIDALDAVIRELNDLVDPQRQSILGYSGGGGNVLSAITKFPDRFQVAASFFGISDYEFWYRSCGRTDCNRRMDEWIGGSPDQFPGRYQARNSARAAGNALNCEVHLFWDEDETQCPPRMNVIFADTARAKGHRAVFCHQSRKGDRFRWHHGYAEDRADLIAAEELLVPRFLQRREDLALPPRGRLVVPGYVATRSFRFWLGDGRDGAAEIEYELDPTPRIWLSGTSSDASNRQLPST